MRGVVLLVDRDGTIDPEPLREAGLRVYQAADWQTALDRLQEVAPDAVIVAGETSALAELRRGAGYATSIIVVGRNQDPPETLRAAGADSCLSPSGDLLYEIHRALILRRSGRRLPWNRGSSPI